MAYAVAIEGLDGVAFGDDVNDKILTSARQAINATADHARTGADRAIRLQVAFSASYLAPSTGRLAVTQRATNQSLAAAITGRGRPTSLARFVTAGRVGSRGDIQVTVKPGVAKFMPRAFLLRLRAGAQDIDETTFNLGLAVRLKPGEVLPKKTAMARLGGGLYLLYGPSVNQVFATVAEDISPPEAQYMEDEFSRLVAL